MDEGLRLSYGAPRGQEGPARDPEGGLERDDDAGDRAYEGLADLGTVLRQGDFSKLDGRMELYLAKTVLIVQDVLDERQNTLRLLQDREATIAGLEKKLELHPGNRMEDLSKIETLWQSNYQLKLANADKVTEDNSNYRSLVKARADAEWAAACGNKELRLLEAAIQELQTELAIYHRLHAHSDAPPPGERLARHAQASAELSAHAVSKRGLYDGRFYREARRDFHGDLLEVHANLIDGTRYLDSDDGD
jgi:hypothetical protein